MGNSQRRGDAVRHGALSDATRSVIASTTRSSASAKPGQETLAASIPITTTVPVIVASTAEAMAIR